jgi:hypothetical protein
LEPSRTVFAGFFSVVVELNYCNNSKKKKEKGGQDERKEGKKRRKGGKGKGRNEREKNDLGKKSINRDDESSVVGHVGRFFFQSPGGLPKTRA